MTSITVSRPVPHPVRSTVTADAAVAGLPLRAVAEIEHAPDARPTLALIGDNRGDDGLTPVVLELAAGGGQSARILHLSIALTLPTADVTGLYACGDPGFELGYLPHERLERTTAAHRGVPLLATLSRHGVGHAIGFTDQLVETRWEVHLSELDCAFHVRIERPLRAGADDPGLHFNGLWRDELFVADGGAGLGPLLRAVGARTSASVGLPPLAVPDHAFEPVFCTWTARHHDISEEWAAQVAPIVADLGFRTWITDDGWQVDGGTFGRYDEVGRWRPSTRKFPDFARHVRGVQDAGLRYLLWVAPFMVGSDAFTDRELGVRRIPGDEGAHFDLLDPMAPATAAHIRRLLHGLADEYGLDGFKIDFIDAMPARVAGEGSTGRAMYEALDRSVGEVARARPGFLVEYRNAYANLANRRTANLYRSSDLPINYVRNRWQATLLRLLAPDAAVVTDPMLWPVDDSDENVAKHLINGIVAVPMVSIDVLSYPRGHLDIVRHWISFYRKHRRTIFGEFRPDIRGTAIPRTTFVGEDEIMDALYDDVPASVDGDPRRRWVLNASDRDSVRLEGEIVARSAPAREGIVRDRVGDIVGRAEVRGDERLAVPVGGSLEVLPLGAPS